MNRWNIKESKNMECPKVDEFLLDVHKVCKKHGFCVEHEDSHGGFIIEKYNNEKDFEWLNHAAIGETIVDKE